MFFNVRLLKPQLSRFGNRWAHRWIDYIITSMCTYYAQIAEANSLQLDIQLYNAYHVYFLTCTQHYSFLLRLCNIDYYSNNYLCIKWIYSIFTSELILNFAPKECVNNNFTVMMCFFLFIQYILSTKAHIQIYSSWVGNNGGSVNIYKTCTL